MSIEITLCTVMPEFNRSYFEKVVAITVRELWIPRIIIIIVINIMINDVIILYTVQDKEDNVIRFFGSLSDFRVFGRLWKFLFS